MYEVNTELAGKDIFTYRPKGNKSYTEQDIAQYLNKFELCSALKLIGEISYDILKSSKQSIISIKGIPIFDGVLAYIAMLLIENSNDYRSENFTINNLLEAIDMYFGLTDPFENTGENPEGCLIRFGSTQFNYERELRHTIPRTLILYRDLWGLTNNSKNINLNKTLQELYQLDLEEMLLLSFAFSFKTEKGFFRLWNLVENKKKLNEHKFSETFINTFSNEKQETFINTISCKYKTFREKYKKDNIDPEYKQFRFNSLINYPVLIPDKNIKPTSGLGQVYITPIPRLIIERVVRGLYYDLSYYFQDGKKNPFKTAFGEVFEEYVGLILHKSIKKYKIKKEFKYGKPAVDSPDWFILDLENKKAIVIEVKQSSLYLPAKTYGEIEDIQKSIKQTIGKGVEQIYKFEQNINDRKYRELEEFYDIEIADKMIVTYDKSYFNNSVLRDQVKEVDKTIPNDYHWHTISIEELEYIVGTLGDNIFDLLTEKRKNQFTDEMDFMDYCARKYPELKFNNSYLNEIENKFFKELKMLKKEQ